ncbi:rod-binding protein [Anaeromicropila populeti]|uniref:Flagellar protein FlgJ n=1 Tax=Anaeromicropila populeti TaxID=37658 RepID=A0A1I6J2T0_9FIRM|nr:rod-binding protein [Anaeromicropila populeti]SFR73258.1 flagellar protein FlgJ [Anaeromicropila populeti]
MSISIGNSNLDLYQSSSLSSTNKAQNLQNTLSESQLVNSTDEELLDVCKSFESYFVEQVFKAMKKTVQSSDEDNEYMKYFGDMMTESYAEEATENSGYGIAQMLYESMKRNGL